MYSYPEARPYFVVSTITPPSLEPVDLADVKTHIEYDADDRDDLIAGFISAAREWVENYTGRTLFDTTLELAAEGYPDWQIYLPKPPIIEIVSFKYRTSDGTDTTLAADQYTLTDEFSLQPRIVPAYGVAWPSTRWQASSLRIRYRAGYARAGSPDERNLIPASLKAAVQLMTGHLFEHREAVSEVQNMAEIPLGVMALCRPYRVEGLGA